MIITTSSSRIHSEIEGLEVYPLAVVPGAGDSVNNPYFKERMNAAAGIYHAGKAKRIVVIGLDDGGIYREPQKMKEALLLRGVPGAVILPDTNGRRTFDAVARARTLAEKGERVLFITQQPHLERVLFIAQCLGLEAEGFPAGKNLRYQHPRYHRQRERLARAKAVLDCVWWKVTGD